MLKGKNAIVTGSTSGIGMAIATMLAENGCNVMINGFGDKDQIEKERKELADKYKVKVAYSAADVTKSDEIEAMVKEAHKTFGSLEILVNNAGIQFTATVDKFPDDKWKAVLETNLFASFYAIKHAVPIMKAQKYGRIINTISVHGLVGSIEKSAYVAAKHGLSGLTKVVALETAEDGITCNGICPGWVLTPLVQKQIDDRAQKEGKDKDAVKKELLEKHAIKEFVKPEEIAGMVVYLCGPYSNPITGSTITVDCGWTAE